MGISIQRWGLSILVATIVSLLPSRASSAHVAMDQAVSRAGTVRVSEVGRGAREALTRPEVLGLRGGGPRFTGGEEEEDEVAQQVRPNCLAKISTDWQQLWRWWWAGLDEPARPPA